MIKLKSLLMEQNAEYWDNVKTIDPKSQTKQKFINYPAQPLMDPKTGLTLAINDSTGQRSELLSISGRLRLQYSPGNSYAKNASELLNSRFSWYAEFFMQATSAKASVISGINGGLLSSGKFISYPTLYLSTWVAAAKSQVVYPAKDSNDTSKHLNSGLDKNNILGNFITYKLLPGYTNYAALNDIVKKMNTELVAAGFQEFTKLSNESPK